jgi:surface antigen
MNRKYLIFLSLTASTALALANPSWALAAANFESCTASASNSYACVFVSGYKGLDPYNVSRFSVKAADGSLHSCTSYAAYRLYYSNPYMPSISNFDSAQYWATQAVSRLGATLSTVPKVGDIAWWDGYGAPSVGHVAVVDSISYTANGGILSVKVSDDNAGRLVTTTKVFYPGVNAGTMIYPQKFIRFPSYGSGGGGSRPPIATNGPLSSPEGAATNLDGPEQ